MGVGNPCHRIGHTGASGYKCHTETACEFAMGMGHMNRGPLVTNIDDTDP
jgi:hypothetical protein